MSDDVTQQAPQDGQPAATGQGGDVDHQSTDPQPDTTSTTQPAELGGVPTADASGSDAQAVTDPTFTGGTTNADGTVGGHEDPPAPSPDPSTSTSEPVNDTTTPDTTAAADTTTVDTTAAPAPAADAPSSSPVVVNTGVADASADTPAAPPVVAAPAPAPFVPDAPPVVLPVPAGTPIVTTPPAAAPVSSGPTGIPSVDAILANVPSSLLYPIIAIKNYMEMMKPGRPQDPKYGAAQQVNLYRAMLTIVNKDTEHFEALFTAMLRMFEHGAEGVFHEIYVFRFTEHVIMNPDEIKGWQKLVNLVKVMGPVDGRELARKAVSIENSVIHLAEDAKNRVLAYFSPTGR